MLNPQQMAAVKYIDGPLLVLAGAGSGKTRVITQKIAYLIEQCSYAASSIFAVTFTNKAANEMQERIASVLPAQKRRGLQVSTFHTLGLKIIKRELAHTKLKKGFSIFDAEDCQQLLRGFLPPAQANDKDVVHTVQQQISRWKNEMLGSADLSAANLSYPNAEIAAHIYSRYEQALEAYNAVDFDDLLRIPVQLLSQHEEIRMHWQNKIRHLLIDEYQDSNSSQYTLVKLLVGLRAQFTVVGDDDQSIYAWRGARPENLAQLQKDYPQLKLIKLEQNYRSSGRILHMANQLIANNTHLFEKKLWSELGLGDLISIFCCKDELHEAEQVVADIISHKLRNATEFGHYAILYRGNHQSRLFEKVLRQQSIPYRLSGGQSWFARAEIKDIFAYLKLLCNEADDAAFLRVVNTPKRGIGESSLSALGHYAQGRGLNLFTACDHMALSELINEKSREALQNFKAWMNGIKKRCEEEPVLEVLKDLVQETAYEAYLYEQNDSPQKAQKKMENIWELIDWIGRLLDKDPKSSLSDVINKLILIDILDKADEATADSLQLMTLHASKGLEFPFVYLAGMEEEILPHRASMDDGQIEEERRLAYVGITRAQKRLCMSLAKQRRRAGEMQDCLPSRFLEELPQESLEWYGKLGEQNEEKSKAMAQNHLAGLRAMLERA